MTSENMENMEEVVVRLPPHLARWLRESAEALALTPDQHLARLLELYRVIWEAARRPDPDLLHRWERIVDEILAEDEKLKRRYGFLIRGFARWLASIGIDPETIAVEGGDLSRIYVRVYAAQHQINDGVRALYASVLRGFITRLAEKISSREHAPRRAQND